MTIKKNTVESPLGLTPTKKTMVALTTQDVCELFCPLSKNELEALTKLINDTQCSHIAPLVSDAIFEGYENFFYYIFNNLKMEAMEEIQKTTTVLASEYSEIVADYDEGKILPRYFYFEDYATVVAYKMQTALKKDTAITLSPLCKWFLKQINVQF